MRFTYFEGECIRNVEIDYAVMNVEEQKLVVGRHDEDKERKTFLKIRKINDYDDIKEIIKQSSFASDAINLCYRCNHKVIDRINGGV